MPSDKSDGRLLLPEFKTDGSGADAAAQPVVNGAGKGSPVPMALSKAARDMPSAAKVPLAPGQSPDIVASSSNGEKESRGKGSCQ